MQLPARAEFRGFVRAVAAPGGVRIAFGNRVVTQTHGAIVRGCLRLARPPWLMPPTGDLWAQRRRVFLSRGPTICAA
eukprot:11191345-Lingulodinium_polyedra.AAC.1